MWWLNMIEKGVIQSAVTSGAVCYWMGCGTSALTNYGFLKSWQVGALAGAISSVTSDALHYLVKEETHLADKVNDMASMGLSVVSSGLVFNSALYILQPNMPNGYGLLAGMVTGAVSEYASSFVYNLLKSYSVLP